MEREVVRYVVKNLGPQVPLFDKSTKSYMIIVEGEPLDIPETLFKTLFKEYEEPIKEDNIVKNLFDSIGAYDVLKKQMEFFKATGISKESLTEMVLKTLPQNDETQLMYARQIIDSLYEESK